MTADLRAGIEALAERYDALNGSMRANAAADLRALLAAHPVQDDEQLLTAAQWGYVAQRDERCNSVTRQQVTAAEDALDDYTEIFQGFVFGTQDRNEYVGTILTALGLTVIDRWDSDERAL